MFKGFGRKASPISPSSKHGRTPLDLDRQRKLAAAIPDPRAWITEANAALYDIDTIFMFSRPPAAHAGIAALEGLHGGAWTKEETALANAIVKSKGDLQASIGRAQQCLADGEVRGSEAFREVARDTVQGYLMLLGAWQDYRRKKGETFMKRVAERAWDQLGGVLGAIQ